MLIHNGMGTVEELRGVKQPLLLASTTRRRGAMGMSSSTLPVAPRISDRQKLRGDYSYLAEVLQSVLPDVARHNNIHSAIWRKLAVNCVINPLTALKGCKTAICATIRRKLRPFVARWRR